MSLGKVPAITVLYFEHQTSILVPLEEQNMNRKGEFLDQIATQCENNCRLDVLRFSLLVVAILALKSILQQNSVYELLPAVEHSSLRFVVFLLQYMTFIFPVCLLENFHTVLMHNNSTDRWGSVASVTFEAQQTRSIGTVVCQTMS